MFKTTKAKVIFVVIFSLICIITTILLILYRNIEIEEIEELQETANIEDVEQIQEKDVQGIDLKGTYNQNDLVIEEKAITQDKIEIRYLQIAGLKDKTVQNKINKEIEQIALNCYKDEVKDLKEIVNIQVSMWEAANFANTISFELSYTAKIDDDNDGYYQGFQGINYDLNTGEKITINELFTSDAPIKDIVRQSAYYNLLANRTEDNLAGDLIVADYGNIEDEVFEVIKEFQKGRLTEFYFTPMQINIYYKENQVITINMEKFAEYIAIYNRYLSNETLYENNNIGIKNLYTLTRRYNDVYYYNNYQNEDNYFIDISIDFQSTEDDVFAKKLVQDKIVEIEKEIENVKQKVNEDPNKFYILNYYISIYTGEEWSIQETLTSCYERGNSYIMSVHDFEENIEPIIIEYNREDENGGVPDFVYDFTHMLDIQPQNTTEYYNPETQEKVVI